MRQPKDSAQNQGPKPRFLVFCALGGAQGIKTPKTLVPSFFWFQKRKIATKGVSRARICVSTPELAMVFRGESVSGHPGAPGGPKRPKNAPPHSNLSSSGHVPLCAPRSSLPSLSQPPMPPPSHLSLTRFLPFPYQKVASQPPMPPSGPLAWPPLGPLPLSSWLNCFTNFATRLARPRHGAGASSSGAFPFT